MHRTQKFHNLKLVWRAFWCTLKTAKKQPSFEMEFWNMETSLIPFYEFGYSQPEKIANTVINEEGVMNYNNCKVICWMLKHEEEGNTELFWISKASHEVLKLEQIINGNLYRYKIKLPY